MKLGFIFRVLFVMLMLFYITKVNAIALSSCTVLTGEGYYTLGDNISISSNPCIYIKNTQFMVLDCEGHYLYSSRDKTAILIENSSNVQITNCHFINNLADVNITDSTNITLSNIHVDGSVVSLYANNSKSIVISSYISSGVKDAIKITNSSSILLEHSEVEGENVGLYGYNVSSFNFTSSIISNFSYGIYLQSSNTIEVYRDNISYNHYGIYSTSNLNLKIYNNILSNSINLEQISSSISLNSSYNCNTNSITSSPCMGGNFWGNITHTDFSDTCEDKNGDGICDSPYTITEGVTDYYPLSRYILINVSILPKDYEINSTFNFYVKGNSYIMPYYTPYTGDISIYADKEYIKNVSVSAGNIDFSFVHTKDKYYKNISLIAYGSNYLSNNTYYLNPSIFSLSIYTGKETQYISYNVPYIINYVSGIYMLLMPTAKDSGYVEYSGPLLVVDPRQVSLLLGVFYEQISLEDIENRIRRYFKRDYCVFSFSSTIQEECKVIIPIFSQIKLNSLFKVLGSGSYVLQVKRDLNSIIVGIK